MQEKQICCCGSSGWTKVIAWLHIIGGAIGAILFVLAIVGAAYLLSADFKNAHGSPQFTPEQIRLIRYLGRAALIFSILKLLLSVLTVVMGIILLRGSTNRNPRQLHYWIVYTVISMVLWVVMTIAECIVYSGAGVLLIIFSLALSLAIQGFCLWVVITHKKEIEASGEPVFPVNN